LVRRQLKEEGFSVDLVENGEEGVSRATIEPYDAIILDIMLPGLDGLSVLRAVRERESRRRCCCSRPGRMYRSGSRD